LAEKPPTNQPVKDEKMTTTQKVRIVCIDKDCSQIGPICFDDKIHEFEGDITDVVQVTAFISTHFRGLVTFIEGWPSGYDSTLDRVNLYIENDSFNSHISCVWLEPAVQRQLSYDAAEALLGASKKLERGYYDPVVIEAGVRFLKFGAGQVVSFALYNLEARQYCGGDEERLMKEVYEMVGMFGSVPVAEILGALETELAAKNMNKAS
jgi:hypothetical protein